MMEFIPLLNIKFQPALNEIFFGLSLSQFDFLPFGELLGKLNIEDDSDGYTENFDTMGYNSSLLI